MNFNNILLQMMEGNLPICIMYNCYNHTQIDPVSQVVISTIQRMFSVLKGDKDYEEENDEFSAFEDPPDEIPVDVKYNENIPNWRI